jgi:hypothetical protein
MKSCHSPLLALPVIFLGAAIFPSAAECASPAYALKSARKPGHIDRVTTVLQVDGNVLQPTGAKGEKSEKSEKVALGVVCNRDYDEKTLEVPAEPSGRWRSVRHYDKATATVKEGAAAEKPALRAERRLIAVALSGATCTQFCPRGSLSEEEAELINAAGNSLPLDQVLPANDVEVGQTWAVPDQALAVLLDLEEVTSNKVQATLKEVTGAVARLELSGHVQGKRYGAAAEMELKAKCRFDLKSHRIDWFAMRVKETREASPVLKALDVTLLVQIQISPKDESPQLTDAALEGLPLEPGDALCQIAYQPAEGNWQLEHDRSWFPFDHHRDLTIFLRVVQGQNIALCKISPLPTIDPEKLVPLERFQAEVQQALGKNFGAFLEAAESTNEPGYRMYRVSVKGQDGDEPVEWHYFLLTDKQGHQMTLVFRVEDKHAEKFGKAGERLVKSVRFVEVRAAGK